MDINKDIDVVSNFPKYVEIQTYSVCNSFCSICPYGKVEGKFPKLKMSDKLINKILDECEIHKDEINCVVPYVNNEPFLDDRLIDILRNIKKRGLNIELSTNASALTQEKAKAIVDEGLVDDFRISFFASDRNDYKILMPRLDYDHVVKNIKFFADYNKKNNNKIHTNIIMILLDTMDMQKNIDKVKEMFGIEVRVFGYLDRAGSNDKKNNLLTDNEINYSRLVGCSTRRPNDWFSILANGDVYICTQDWNRENKLGNVENNSIVEVWNNEKYKWYRDIIFGREKTPKDFICKKCKIAIYNDSKENKLNFNGDKYVDREGKKHVKI